MQKRFDAGASPPPSEPPWAKERASKVPFSQQRAKKREAITISRLEAIDIRLETITSRLEAIASRLEALVDGSWESAEVWVPTQQMMSQNEWTPDPHRSV